MKLNNSYPNVLRSDDPLDMAAGEVDVRFPLLQERLRKMKIISPEIAESSKDPNIKMLVFKLETLETEISTEKQTLHPGFRFITRITITETDKRDKTAIARDLAALLQSVEGKNSTTKLSTLRDHPEILDGKMVMVKVGIQPEKDGFPASNSARFIPVD